MANDRAKESKGFFNQLKKTFRFGSRSTAAIDPVEAAKLRAKYTHFRILIVGRANAGKTTLLKRVCNTKEDPIYNTINPTSKRGIHNVREGFSFKNNPEFIFHDSPGFEAGGEEELTAVMSFIQERANAKNVKDQIHAIWFCFYPDVSRPLLQLEVRFFNEVHARNVPVVAIFTKFDDFITQIYDRSKNEKENTKIAVDTLERIFERPLRSYNFPPRAYVRFESIHEDEGNHQEQVGELIKQTTNSIDNLALKMLFVTVQKNNLKVCIECAVNPYIFESTNTMEGMIRKTASWFGHFFYRDHDYGEDEHLHHLLLRLGDDHLQLKYIQNVISAQFNTPSLPAFIAIIICLEHSFWLVQKGSSFSEGFTDAFDIYLGSQFALLDQKLKDHPMLKEENDWFATRYHPSEEKCIECQKIVFDNLLSHPIL